jgi:hypothetical protein
MLDDVTLSIVFVPCTANETVTLDELVVIARFINVATPDVAFAATEFPLALPALGVATIVIVPAGTALPY